MRAHGTTPSAPRSWSATCSRTSSTWAKGDPAVPARAGDKDVVLGVIAVGTDVVETAEAVAARVRALVDGVRIVRQDLAGDPAGSGRFRWVPT